MHVLSLLQLLYNIFPLSRVIQSKPGYSVKTWLLFVSLIIPTTLPSPEGVHRAECAGDDTGGHDILSGCLSFHPLLHTENQRRFCNTTKCNELPQPPDNQVGILRIF